MQVSISRRHPLTNAHPRPTVPVLRHECHEIAPYLAFTSYAAKDLACLYLAFTSYAAKDLACLDDIAWAGLFDRLSPRRHFPNASSSGPNRGRLAVVALAGTQYAWLPGLVM